MFSEKLSAKELNGIVRFTGEVSQSNETTSKQTRDKNCMKYKNNETK